MAARWSSHESSHLDDGSGHQRTAKTTFHLRASVFAGYHVEAVLSTGFMGAVLTAHHEGSEQRVVLKLLHPELSEDPMHVARLSREAHVLARVASDHVVRLLDTGWDQAVGPFLVLEYLEGHDLARLLADHGPLPRELATDLTLQACAALGVVHAAGIVHRDVKPENLLCVTGEKPKLKLLDFGIAQHGPTSFPHREVADCVPETLLIGTPSYMAPERILDLPDIDQRSDIWSLGVVLHELLTARRLFATKDPTETCARVLRHRFELEPDPALLPPALRRVVARCLARQPRHRYQNVDELAEALRGAVAQPESVRGSRTGKFQRHAASAAAPGPAALARRELETRFESLASERWRCIGSALSFALAALLVLVAVLALMAALTG